MRDGTAAGGPRPDGGPPAGAPGDRPTPGGGTGATPGGGTGPTPDAVTGPRTGALTDLVPDGVRPVLPSPVSDWVDRLPLRRVPGGALLDAAVRIVEATVRICLRYRVTGLAAEAGFFALLSVPPLFLGLVAAVGFAGRRLGGDVLTDLRRALVDAAGTVLTPETVSGVIAPTFDEVATGGRPAIVSVGFVLSVWSGSRALNVYVDTVSIMYGLGGQRGIVRTRALSFSLYVGNLVLGAVVLPLMLLGPSLLSRFLGSRFAGMPPLERLGVLYWPVVLLTGILALAMLYHVATPIRTAWRRDVPGAVLAVAIWVVASAVLRITLGRSVGGTSIYGPLAAPIVLLMWLYMLAIAVLVGAALNAAVDLLVPYRGRVRTGVPLPPWKR